MSAAETDPTIGGALAAAFRSLWAERGSAAGLFVVYFLVAALMLYVPFELYADLFDAILHDRPYQPEAAPGDNLWLALAVMTAIGLSGGGLVMAMIGRLIAGGRDQVLAGGGGALLRRTLWVAWRLAEGLVLIVLAYLFLYFLLGSANRLYTLAGDAVWQGAVALLHIILVMGLIVLSLLAVFAVVGQTVWAACNDERRGLGSAWRALEGRRLRLMLTQAFIIVGASALAAVLFALAAALFPAPGAAHYAAGLLGLSLADFLAAWLWLGSSGAFARAIGSG